MLLACASFAFVPRSGPKLAADTLTALPGAGVSKPLRVQPRLAFARASKAWDHFAATGKWQAEWDAATGVPMRIWGSGLSFPGANGNAAIAEAAARQVLADHLALLAPGASVTDFELVSNVSDGEIRSVGFFQRAGGLRVVGGQIGFEFKRDRLFVIGSSALPNVPAMTLAPRAALLAPRATANVRDAVGLPSAPVSAPDADVILPLVGDDAVLGFRRVAPLTIDGQADGRYQAYADVTSGEIVAVQQLNDYATGTVMYNGVNRWPGRGYVPRPAPYAQVPVNGVMQTTGADGSIAWSPDATAQVQTSTIGSFVMIVNEAGQCALEMTPTPCWETTATSDCTMPMDSCMLSMTSSMTTMSIAPGGSILWDASAMPVDDAQIDAYLDTNIAKDYARTYMDPSLSWLDDQLEVRVNEDQTCNAYWDGKFLNFFRSSPPGTHCTDQNPCCNNTAQIQDVNFHEFGHGLHAHEVIQGVGFIDGAMGEGQADFFAANLTNDSGMGRGFFFNDNPLRELEADPSDGHEWRWPDDIAEIHHTGMIFGGTWWDLRTAAIAQLGQTAGIALVDKLYIGVLRRSINIPTSLVEALATDDDDGDLSNGTPHECLIRDTFAMHGLRTVAGTIEAPGKIDQLTLAIGIAIDVTGLSTRCSGDVITGAQLVWSKPNQGGGEQDAVQESAGRFYAQLPLSQHDTVLYQANVVFADGSHMSLPDNLAGHDRYQTYSGPTVALYCNDFESGDPLQNGWFTGADSSVSPSTWAWTIPAGGATNPPTAYSGTHVLAQDPNTDYQPNQHAWIEMPDIDVGNYTDVRLQFRRWLAVEDSHFDQARILVNGKVAWVNASQDTGFSWNNLDKEWRFQDVPLNAWTWGHTMKIAWDLKSDAGLEFAGWTLDDVCVVANPLSICGDGVKQRYEQCDNGSMNADAPDACRTYCRLPTCGDDITDSGEECDDGPNGSTACTDKCMLIPPKPGSSGCCSSSGGAPGSLALGAIMVGLLARRRRAAAAR